MISVTKNLGAHKNMVVAALIALTTMASLASLASLAAATDSPQLPARIYCTRWMMGTLLSDYLLSVTDPRGRGQLIVLHGQQPTTRLSLNGERLVASNSDEFVLQRTDRSGHTILARYDRQGRAVATTQAVENRQVAGLAGGVVVTVPATQPSDRPWSTDYELHIITDTATTRVARTGKIVSIHAAGSRAFLVHVFEWKGEKIPPVDRHELVGLDGKVLWSHEEPSDVLFDERVSPDGRLLVWGRVGKDPKAELLDTGTGKTIPLEIHLPLWLWFLAPERMIVMQQDDKMICFTDAGAHRWATAVPVKARAAARVQTKSGGAVVVVGKSPEGHGELHLLALDDGRRLGWVRFETAGPDRAWDHTVTHLEQDKAGTIKMVAGGCQYNINLQETPR